MQFNSRQVMAIGVGNLLLGVVSAWLGATFHVPRSVEQRAPPSVLIIWMPTQPTFDVDIDEDLTVQYIVHKERRGGVIAP